MIDQKYISSVRHGFIRATEYKKPLPTEEQIKYKKMIEERDEYMKLLQRILLPYCENKTNVQLVSFDMFRILKENSQIDTIVDMSNYGFDSVDYIYDISAVFPERFRYIKLDEDKKLSKAKHRAHKINYVQKHKGIEPNKQSKFYKKKSCQLFLTENNIQLYNGSEIEFINFLKTCTLDNKRTIFIVKNDEIGFLINYMFEPHHVYYADSLNIVFSHVKPFCEVGKMDIADYFCDEIKKRKGY